MDAIFPLQGVIKKYDWGGIDYISQLLKIDNAQQDPFAEYWMGVHPQGIASVQTSTNEWIPLTKLTMPLPFLFKVLDVKDMLSIQVHPTKENAILDFDRENKLGIPLDSPIRNYKDNNHKPELMVALSEFWLLHGFRPSSSLLKILNEIKELNSLLPVFEKQGYEGLYRRVMEMTQLEVDDLLKPLRDRIVPLYEQGELSKSQPDFWAARAFLTFSNYGYADRGIFSVYFFNLVQMQPGQAVFQDAGIPHAYLEGQNVEIMANSDNVLRGGLTNKHIDVTELLKHVRCISVEPNVLPAKKEKESWFETPVEDFRLGQLNLEAGEELIVEVDKPSIFLCISGQAVVEAGGRSIFLGKGQPAAFCTKGVNLTLHSQNGALIFRATDAIHNR
ncbi:MAG: mannose-6-phosphate isomerase, class I [Chitinophagaceae bacterium]